MRSHFVGLFVVLCGLGVRSDLLHAQGQAPSTIKYATAPYHDLLRAVDSPRPWEQGQALEALGQRFPDSARVWALRRIGSLAVAARLTAVHWILRRDGSGLADLIALFPRLPDSTITGLQFPMFTVSEAVERSGADADSIAGPLVSSSRASIRALAISLVSNVMTDRQVSEQGRAILARGASDPDARVRQAAMEGIAEVMGDDPSATEWGTPFLVMAMRDRSAKVRERVLRSIAWHKIPLPGQLDLIRMIARSDEARETRLAAIDVIGMSGDPARPAIPDLLKFLGNPDRLTRVVAAHAIAQLIEDRVQFPPEVVIALRTYALQGGEPWDRADGVRTLGILGDTFGVVRATSDHSDVVAGAALETLAEMAPLHPALTNALDDRRAAVRARAKDAIVPGLLRDSTAFVPATPDGHTARDAALAVARKLQNTGLPGRCFEFRWEPFQPALDIGGDSVYSLPPRTVAFLASAGSAFWDEAYWAKVVPANGADGGVHPTGSWSWNENKRILEVVWTTGFSGVSFRGTASGTGYTGTLTPSWDFPREHQTAAATMVPTTCDRIGPLRPRG